MEVQQLKQLDKRHVMHPTTAIKDHFKFGPLVMMTRGEGIYLYDAEGKKYIDGLSSLWNVHIGHGREELAEVAAAQMREMAFSHSFNRFTHENAIRLSEALAELAPGDLNVCHFTSGGSESNDSAFKFVRYYFKLIGQGERYKIISRHRAYHGVTIGAMSATGIPAFHQMGGPLAEGFYHAAAPYTYRCTMCGGECDAECAVDSIRSIIEREGPETVAAVILEPIQGAGGVIVPPIGYLKKVRELCDQHGILLIADEVITGFGRTGKWFGTMHEEIVPDVMTFAKGVTSGYFPLGGVVLREELYRRFVEHLGEGQVMPHGFTYSGHPTACAVALKNLEIIADEKLVENAEKMGKLLRRGLDDLCKNSRIVGNVMSRGLLASLELVRDKEKKTPFDPSVKAANRFFEKALDRGLITRGIMIDQTDIVALCPPLIVNERQVGDILTILEDCVNALEKEIL